MPDDSEIVAGDTSSNEADTPLPSGRPSPIPGALQVYQTGELSVVGFGGEDVPEEYCLSLYRDELAELVNRHQCQELAFDMTGVRLVPSGMLGLMTSIHNLGVKVTIYNPSSDVRDVLDTTRLDRLFQVRDVDD